MAKIGVYTYSRTLNNYGETLQFLATQEYLKRRGHDVSLLRIEQVLSLTQRIKMMLFKLYLKAIGMQSSNDKFSEWAKVSETYEKQHPRFFEKFRQENFNIVECTTKNIEKFHFDAYVAGSDQIWAGVSSIPFLYFPPFNITRFSIASSTGNLTFSSKQLSRVSKYLKLFDFVTTREASGVKMCNDASYFEATQVLDPTFLISEEGYRKYEKDFNSTKDYVFVYLLGADVDLSIDEIYDFANSKGLDVKYVASQGRKDDFEKTWATISEWLGLIRSAKYVITNSFHGTALSIIYHKPFVVLPIIGELSRMNERVTEILRRFNLSERLLENKDLSVLYNPIDFSTSEKEIEQNWEKLDKLMCKVNM